jgi:hypothetical protein
VLEVLAEAQPQRQKGARQRPGHGDDFSLGIVDRHGIPSHDHRPVAVAHAGPTRAQRVFFVQIGVGVDADGGQFKLTAEGAPIQRLNVDQLVGKRVRP